MSTDAYEFTTFDGFSPTSAVGPYRAADYWVQEEGAPIELINGKFVMSPAPISYHQTLVAQLWRVIQSAEDLGGGIGYFSPIDVVFDDKNVVQPDLIYLTKDRLHQIGDRIDGPPSLVIEVLSPSTSNRDRQEKLALYAKFRVPEYWIVDPAARTFDFLVNDGGRYVVTPARDNAYQSSVTAEIQIDLAAFWAEVDRRLPKTNAE